MRKVELSRAVYDSLDGKSSRSEAADLVDVVFAEMKGALARGEEVKITGFGTFQVRDKATREGRNPQTGKPLMISARRIVRFKASVVFKAAMNDVSKEPPR